jgi:hypothetical protein
MKAKVDPFDLARFRAAPDGTPERLVVVPRKIEKRRQQFIQMPMTWYERLRGADGQTYRVALYLLHLHWKTKGDPIKLANGMLAIDGVPPTTKRRAIRDLERRRLVMVEWRSRKSPIVRLNIAVDGEAADRVRRSS